jgi:hypothetical protein
VPRFAMLDLARAVEKVAVRAPSGRCLAPTRDSAGYDDPGNRNNSSDYAGNRTRPVGQTAQNRPDRTQL